MLLSKTVKLKWNSKIKNYYVKLGYVFTKMKDEFEVSVEHLTKGSAAKILVKCDYCGKEHETIWERYFNSHDIVSKDSCGDPACTGKKASESIIKKYGTRNLFEIDEINKKRIDTNIERYGVENPFSSKEIQEKIKNTNMKKYGCAIPTQNPEIIIKSQQTCMEKYGVINYGAIYSREHTKELSPTWKGGVKYSRVERATFEYRQWRKSVFSRDLYTCQCCGSKNGNGVYVELHAHHIMDWKHNEEARYEVENGITLCVDCHTKFHSKYGKSGNDELQLNEFLKKYKDKKIC